MLRSISFNKFILYRNDHNKWRKIEFWGFVATLNFLQLQSSLQYGMVYYTLLDEIKKKFYIQSDSVSHKNIGN